MRDGGLILPGGTVNVPTSTTAKGFWTPDEARDLQPIGTTNWYRWPMVTPDPNFSSVRMLHHCQPGDVLARGTSPADGAGIKDYSGFGHTLLPSVTRGHTPSAFLTNAATLFGVTVGYTGGGINGFVDSLSSAHLQPGTGEFTIEIWFRVVSTLSTSLLVDLRNGPIAIAAPTTYFDGAGVLHYYTLGSDRIVSGAGVVVINTWQFMSVSRQAGTTYLHVDGTNVGSWVDATSYGCYTYAIGGGLVDNPGASDFYWTENRYTVGVGRYGAANYTVPSTPFADY